MSVASPDRSHRVLGAIIPLVADFVQGHGGVTEGEAREWEAEQRDLGERGEFFFGCIQFCFTATKTR